MAIDAENMAQVLEQFPRQCGEALELPKGIYVSGKVANIVILGMGGSGIVADLTATLMRSQKTPVHVVRDYTLPGFANKDSLVIAVSYSGKTEETIAACREALERESKVVGISSGGDIAALCPKHIRIPEGLQPRAALGYLFLPVLGLLSNSKLIGISHEDITEALTILSNVAEFKQRGQTLVKLIKGRTPIIYASELLKPVAMRWKTQFNENAKMPAFCNSFPEMNHNELCGYESMKREEMVALLLRDPQDHERIRKRMDICREMMKQTVDVIEVAPRGASLLARMLSFIYLGDWASYYAAIERKVDPTPVHIIQKLKREMAS